MQQPETSVVPATPDRWSDVVELLGVSGETGCWCQAWRGFDAKAVSRGRTRPQLLREQMEGGPPPPGYLAYLDGLAVLPVWSIGCFQIRPGYRRRGIAKALLAGVIEAARDAGAPGVEAYPIDPEGQRVEVGAGYVGIASMFDAAGFRRVLVTDARSGRLPRLLVRLDFAS